MKRTVQDVMTRTVAVIGEDTEFKQIVDKMDEYRVSALPVIDVNDRLLGIVTETDLLMKEEHPDLGPAPRHLETPTHRSVRRKASARTARDLMTNPTQTVVPQAPLAEAARVLHELGVHQLVVVDEKERVVGIVTRRDLLKVFLRSDEEIEREISELLGRTLSIPDYVVRVRVRRGLVSLEGELERGALVSLLVELVQRIDGVVAVDNRLSSRAHDEESGASEFTAPWARFNTPRVRR
jgi:CBS domain-containing protein